MKGPGLYSDIGKKAKDLLGKDYISDQKVSISTLSTSGLGLTTSGVKKGGLYSFEICSQYKYNNTLVDFKVDTDSNISTTYTIFELLPDTKTIATLNLPDYTTGKLEVQYFHEHGSFASTMALKQTPVVDLSVTLGVEGAAIGAEAGYDTASGSFTKYAAAARIVTPGYDASVIFGDKGDSIRASYVHYLSEKQKNAVVGEITRKFSSNENVVTIGGHYELDPITAVKVKLNSSGKLGVLLQHELRPKSVLTLSGEFETKALDKTPKFGLALALKP